MITEDRRQVQTRLDVNMVVEAGAGTGKTTLLIDRLCLAVLARNIQVEKLVALTFTEKAAAEIKTRFMDKLQGLIRAVKENLEDRTLTLLREDFAVPDTDLVSRAEHAMARLDRASIGTIHGFCADILKAFPLEAGLAPNAQIDAGQRAARIFDARWNTFLDQELGVHSPRAEQWKKVLVSISLPDLKNFARELCRGKIESYDYYAHKDKLAAVCLERARRAEEIAAAFTRPGKKLRNAEAAVAAAAVSLKSTAAFLQGNSVPQPPQEPAPSFPAVAYKDWDEAVFEEARSLVSFALKITPQQQTLFLDALHLVQQIAAEVRAEYAREGILSFDDLIVQTRNLLQNNLYVRRLLKEKFDVLFIDEFQDTDPIQGELLLFLAEAKESSAAHWRQVQLAPGKLFVVGDPKQSIYRFRGADITAYELFTDLILKQGGIKCFLRQNFRSEWEIIQTANAVCSRAMVQQPAFQPAYEPIFTAKTAGTQAVKWLFVVPPTEQAPSADNLRDNQGEQIADWIEQNVGVMTLSCGRKLEYRDIVLLTRASTTAGPYIEALRRRGIRFNVETDKDFYRKQEINDFLNFLRAAVDWQDRTALAGVLRSPLFGLTDEAIYQTAIRGELTLSAQPADPQLARCYGLLKQFSQRAGLLALKDFLQSVLDDTFLPEACAAAYEGEQTLDNLNRLLTMAQGYAADGAVSVQQFLSEIQTLLEEEPERLGSPAPDDALNAVSVMTVHKSKGLEFPVVILADLTKRDSAAAAHPASHIFSWQYNMHGLRVGKVCDANLAFLEEEQKKHSQCEEVRVLYVALTRAKEKLLLTADGRKDALKATAAAFAAAGLFPDLQTRPDCLQQQELSVPVCYAAYRDPETFRYRHAEAAPAQEEARLLPGWRSAYERRRERYEQLLTHALKQTPSERVEENSQLTQAQQQAAQLGTICHRVLERILGRGEADDFSTILKAAEQAGIPDRAKEAEMLLNPFLHSPLFQQIRACKILGCEMPFSFLAADGSVESGVMDAALEQSDGTIWILDYKTDQIKPGREQAVLEEKYLPQLTVYAQAGQKLFPKRSVRCSAVFLRTIAAADL